MLSFFCFFRNAQLVTAQSLFGGIWDNNTARRCEGERKTGRFIASVRWHMHVYYDVAYVLVERFVMAAADMDIFFFSWVMFGRSGH